MEQFPLLEKVALQRKTIVKTITNKFGGPKKFLAAMAGNKNYSAKDFQAVKKALKSEESILPGTPEHKNALKRLRALKELKGVTMKASDALRLMR